MSNVKEVRIRGEMTFDAFPLGTDGGDAGARVIHERIVGLLGWLNMPTFGLRIVWSRGVPGGMRFIPNERGGATAMYRYTISGSEAVSWEALADMVALLSKVGEVHQAQARDIENDGDWCAITPKEVA